MIRSSKLGLTCDASLLQSMSLCERTLPKVFLSSLGFPLACKGMLVVVSIKWKLTNFFRHRRFLALQIVRMLPKQDLKLTNFHFEIIAWLS